MGKIKTSKTLIKTRLGSPSQCSYCGSPKVVLVMHRDYGPIYLKGESEETKEAIDRRFKKQASEYFLCRSCYDSNYKQNPAYLQDSGQYEYTTMEIQNWKKVEFLTIFEAVEKYG